MHFTGPFFEVYHPPFEEVRRRDYGKRHGYFHKIEEKEGRSCFTTTEEERFQNCFSISTGKLQEKTVWNSKMILLEKKQLRWNLEMKTSKKMQA